jgi:hypothetical protein
MSGLAAVIHRFPEQEFNIRLNYGRRPDFAELCTDYLDAKNALDRWKRDNTLSAEYWQIVVELEEEIQRHLAVEDHQFNQDRVHK